MVKCREVREPTNNSQQFSSGSSGLANPSIAQGTLQEMEPVVNFSHRLNYTNVNIMAFPNDRRPKYRYQRFFKHKYAKYLHISQRFCKILHIFWRISAKFAKYFVKSLSKIIFLLTKIDSLI